MAFPFLALFLAFVIFLAIRYKSTDAKVQKIQDDFWEREAQANITPQIDLDNLTYITIPLDNFHLVSAMSLLFWKWKINFVSYLHIAC